MLSVIDWIRSKDNPTDAYERFFYSKRYLRFKSAAHTGKEEDRRIGRALGYNMERTDRITKVRRRRAQFDNLEINVPYEYLEAIGADLDELLTCTEADWERFEAERRKPRYPKQAAIRLMAAVYASYTFPEGTSENEAIELLNRSKWANLKRFILYPQLVQVGLHEGADAEAWYAWFKPVLHQRKRWLEPALGGVGVLQTRVG